MSQVRPQEQQRLLLALIGRGDEERAPAIRARLHLLAAACLEYVHEVDDEVLSRVKSAASALIPPKRFGEAQLLATAGDLVLEMLPPPAKLPARTAASVVRTAALIGGPAALGVIEKYRHDQRQTVRSELLSSLERFDSEEYARRVLHGLDWVSLDSFHIRTESDMKALQYIAHTGSVSVIGDLELNRLSGASDLTQIAISDNRMVSDLTFLKDFPKVHYVSIRNCENFSSFRGIEESPNLKFIRFSSGDYGSCPDFGEGSESVAFLALEGVRSPEPGKMVAAFPNMKEVAFERCYFGTGLGQLAALRKLSKLYILDHIYVLGASTFDEFHDISSMVGSSCSNLSDSILGGLETISVSVGGHVFFPSTEPLRQIGVSDAVFERIGSSPVAIFLRHMPNLLEVESAITSSVQPFIQLIRRFDIE